MSSDAWNIAPLIAEWNQAREFFSHFERELSAASYVLLAISLLSTFVGLWYFMYGQFCVSSSSSGVTDSLTAGLLEPQSQSLEFTQITHDGDLEQGKEKEKEKEKAGKETFRIYLNGGPAELRGKKFWILSYLSLGMPLYESTPEALRYYLSKDEFDGIRAAINRRLMPIPGLIGALLVYGTLAGIRYPDTLSPIAKFVIKLMQAEPSLITIIWISRAIQYEMVKSYCDKITKNNITFRMLRMKWQFMWSGAPGLNTRYESNYIQIVVDKSASSAGKMNENENTDIKALGLTLTTTTLPEDSVAANDKDKEKKRPVIMTDFALPLDSRVFEKPPEFAEEYGLSMRQWRVICTAIRGSWDCFFRYGVVAWKDCVLNIVTNVNEHFIETGSRMRVHVGFTFRHAKKACGCGKARRMKYTYLFPLLRVTANAETMVDVMQLNVADDGDDDNSGEHDTATQKIGIARESGFFPLSEVHRSDLVQTASHMATSGRGPTKHVSLVTLPALLLSYVLYSPITKYMKPIGNLWKAQRFFFIFWVLASLTWLLVGVTAGNLSLTWFHGLLCTLPGTAISVCGAIALWGSPKYKNERMKVAMISSATKLHSTNSVTIKNPTTKTDFTVPLLLPHPTDYSTAAMCLNALILVCGYSIFVATLFAVSVTLTFLHHKYALAIGICAVVPMISSIIVAALSKRFFNELVLGGFISEDGIRLTLR